MDITGHSEPANNGDYTRPQRKGRAIKPNGLASHLSPDLDKAIEIAERNGYITKQSWAGLNVATLEVQEELLENAEAHLRNLTQRGFLHMAAVRDAQSNTFVEYRWTLA